MINVALFTGGNSGEYEISLKTAKNIETLLDKDKFQVYTIIVKGKSWTHQAADGSLVDFDKNDLSITISDKKIVFDVAFIALHGDPGENGKMQSYFEMMEFPYTGCDSFVSSLTFNKYFCNVAVKECNVPVSPSLHYYINDAIEYDEIEAVCEFPCFVKPCNSGSSVGVSKVHNREELKTAIEHAFAVDHQIMVEKNIAGREYTCGVAMVAGEVKVLAVSEIISKKEFYDYEAKYTPGFLEMVTPAQIDEKLELEIKNFSKVIYTKLGCKAVVRLDFIVNEDGIPCFLELNAIPGQTAMSIIPKQLQYCQIELKDFYASLIYEALSI